MPLLKRATKQLAEQGIALQVIKGCYGPYLYDPSLRKQRGKVYKSAEDAVAAAVAGERPVDEEEQVDALLHAHASAWWSDIEAPDFVEKVNATYDLYLAAGGTDTHYDANWRTFSDAAKKEAQP